MPTNDGTTPDLPKPTSNLSADHHYVVTPPPSFSRKGKSSRITKFPPKVPRGLCFFEHFPLPGVAVCESEMRVHGLSQYEGHTVQFPTLCLYPALGSCLSRDKAEKCGGAAASLSCVLNKVKSPLGENYRLLQKK